MHCFKRLQLQKILISQLMHKTHKSINWNIIEKNPWDRTKAYFFLLLNSRCYTMWGVVDAIIARHWVIKIIDSKGQFYHFLVWVEFSYNKYSIWVFRWINSSCCIANGDILMWATLMFFRLDYFGVNFPFSNFTIEIVIIFLVFLFPSYVL